METRTSPAFPRIREGARVAVVGSRFYPDLQDVEEFMYSIPMSCSIVTGGAQGVDKKAENVAIQLGMKVTVFYPDWKGLGRAAGPVRNRNIVHNADVVVAFWDGSSKGTASTIAVARAAEKPTFVYEKKARERRPGGSQLPQIEMDLATGEVARDDEAQER